MSIAEKLTTIAENEQKVYDAGVKSEYDRFWDIFQKNGDRRNYYAAFGGWTEDIFHPKYDIIAETLAYAFSNNSDWSTGVYIDDFVEFCKEEGIVFDTTNCGNYNNAFGLLRTRRLGTLNFTKVAVSSGVNNVFYPQNNYLQTIDELVSGEKTPWQSNTFQHATGLINMNVTGVIGTNNFNVSYCTKLTHDSLVSVINCLKDYSEDTSGTNWVVTMGTTNLAKLTDEEKAVATEKGWTLA